MNDYPIDKHLDKIFRAALVIIRTFMQYNSYPWSMVQAALMLSSTILAIHSVRRDYIDTIDSQIERAMRHIFGGD